jgi:hypothetical protein
MEQVMDLEMILAKIQATFGTMATPLTSADYVQPGKPVLGLDVATAEVETVGVTFGQDSSVVGAREASFSCSFPMRSGAAEGVPGDWALFLQACGFKETINGHIHSYAIAQSQADWKDLTLWAFSGGHGSNAALRQVIANALFSAKINLDFNTCYGSIDFTGKGAYAELPVVATQPTCTRKTLKTPNLLGFRGFFMMSSYHLLSLNFDIANEISVVNNPQASDGSGKGVSLLTSMKIKFDAKVYVDTAMSEQPQKTLTDGTSGTITVAFGTEPNAFSIVSGAAQIISVKESEQNKVKTYDISGICVDNNLTISVDTTVPA